MLRFVKKLVMYDTEVFIVEVSNEESIWNKGKLSFIYQVITINLTYFTLPYYRMTHLIDYTHYLEKYT